MTDPFGKMPITDEAVNAWIEAESERIQSKLVDVVDAFQMTYKTSESPIGINVRQSLLIELPGSQWYRNEPEILLARMSKIDVATVADTPHDAAHLVACWLLYMFPELGPSDWIAGVTMRS